MSIFFIQGMRENVGSNSRNCIAINKRFRPQESVIRNCMPTAHGRQNNDIIIIKFRLRYLGVRQSGKITKNMTRVPKYSSLDIFELPS